MTMWIVTQTDRFKAAVSHAGLSNHISFYVSQDKAFLNPQQKSKANQVDTPVACDLTLGLLSYAGHIDVSAAL